MQRHASPAANPGRYLSSARAVWCVVTLACLAAAGCNSFSKADPTPKVAVIERDFAVPPRQMLQIAKQAVTQAPASLPVESEEKGSFVTGWNRHRGEWHTARHWQERTRYRVTVIPDWDEPAARSRVQVVQETQQRRAEGQTWKPAPGLVRHERAQKILDQIAAAAAAGAPAGAGARP